ncbi:MAG TPA: ATP-binding protein [Oscillospiraceae bacterium]|nr:ATP-binding protein [Oscillospiraceae bacterium]HPF56408.1 ATP-binding protein [Clostridiales bacterium]HPK35292.1 ATP-binding protein [Oscillospiraceae bacterium]
MKELSLNILDIAQNSVTAGATEIKILVDEQPAENTLRIVIEDNGSGMDQAFLERVTDPFTTTRTTRKVGLGIPLFKQAAEMTGGKFSITSKVGVGTTVTADFIYDSIDRMPIGDMPSTITALLGSKPGIDWIYEHRYGKSTFTFSSREIIRQVGDIDFTQPEITEWIAQYISEQLHNLYGGKV